MNSDSVPEHSVSLGKRVDYRGRIHPELDDKAEQHLKVAIFGCHCRDNRAEAKGKGCKHHNQYGEKKCIPGKVGHTSRISNCVNNVDNYKESELDAKPDEIANDI